MIQTLTDYISCLFNKDQSQDYLLSNSNEYNSSLLLVSTIFFIGLVILVFAITIVFLFIKLYTCHETTQGTKDIQRDEEQSIGEPLAEKQQPVVDVIHYDIYHEVNN